MIDFWLVVAPAFWDGPRRWPAGCRPVVFSTELVMRNAGRMQAPAACSAAVEQLLRAHPAVLSITRASRAAASADSGRRKAA